MIFDATAQHLIGNLGWIDKGALWICNLNTRTEDRIAIDNDAVALGLSEGTNGFFRLVPHGSPNPIISIRHSREPRVELASVRLNRHDKPRFVGDNNLWEQVDAVVVLEGADGPRLLRIDPFRERIVDLDLNWFNADAYDLVYQGLVDCLTLPAKNLIVVSVQRSSRLIVIDYCRNEKVGEVGLADRGGNPQLCMRTDNDFLASDYDTLCRVEIDQMTMVAGARLQDAAPSNTRQFIGDYQLLENGTIVVARPFSADALLVGACDFRVIDRAPVEGQPLGICMVSEFSAVTRDWKTGRVGIAQFSRTG